MCVCVCVGEGGLNFKEVTGVMVIPGHTFWGKIHSWRSGCK